jgi:prevent-host-death family protein
MDKQLNIYEAKTRFSELVEKVGKGEEFIIAKNGKPAARLVGIAHGKAKPRKLGQLKGKLVIAADFDAPDLEIEKLFYGKKTRYPR